MWEQEHEIVDLIAFSVQRTQNATVPSGIVNLIELARFLFTLSKPHNIQVVQNLSLLWLDVWWVSRALGVLSLSQETLSLRSGVCFSHEDWQKSNVLPGKFCWVKRCKWTDSQHFSDLFYSSFLNNLDLIEIVLPRHFN